MEPEDFMFMSSACVSVCSGEARIVKLLLAAGAEVDAADAEGCTALHSCANCQRAVAYRCVDVAKVHTCS